MSATFGGLPDEFRDLRSESDTSRTIYAHITMSGRKRSGNRRRRASFHSPSDVERRPPSKLAVVCVNAPTTGIITRHFHSEVCHKGGEGRAVRFFRIFSLLVLLS